MLPQEVQKSEQLMPSLYAEPASLPESNSWRRWHWHTARFATSVHILWTWKNSCGRGQSTILLIPDAINGSSWICIWTLRSIQPCFIMIDNNSYAYPDTWIVMTCVATEAPVTLRHRSCFWTKLLTVIQIKFNSRSWSDLCPLGWLVFMWERMRYRRSLLTMRGNFWPICCPCNC